MLRPSKGTLRVSQESSPIRPIRSDSDHRAALRQIESLMGAAPETPALDRLEVLTTLVDAYEREHHPIEPPDPIDAIKFRMEQLGWTRKELTSLIFKTSARTAEILGGKRALTKAMIRLLAEKLGLRTDVLLGVSRAPSPPGMKTPRKAGRRAGRDSHP
ncbi:MAG: hypothetical protein NVS3B10_20500 [Polyangiales bacterium]